MLSAKERANYLRLEKKMNDPHKALTDKEIDEYESRAMEYVQTPIGHLQGFLDTMNSIGSWTNKIAHDNLRLVQEIRFLKNALQSRAVELPDAPAGSVAGQEDAQENEPVTDV